MAREDFEAETNPSVAYTPKHQAGDKVTVGLRPMSLGLNNQTISFFQVVITGVKGENYVFSGQGLEEFGARNTLTLSAQNVDELPQNIQLRESILTDHGLTL